MDIETTRTIYDKNNNIMEMVSKKKVFKSGGSGAVIISSELIGKTVKIVYIRGKK